VSYVEVFGDDVTDLLDNGARCGHSKVSAQRYVLSGATGRKVDSLEEIAELLEQGELQKRKAATAMNDRSSRAHALFIMTLDQYDVKTDRRVKSQLFLADLGGVCYVVWLFHLLYLSFLLSHSLM
jgi:kinesin family member 5